MFFIMAEENARQSGDTPEHTDLIVETVRDILEGMLPSVGEYVLVEAAKNGAMKNPYLLKHKSLQDGEDHSGGRIVLTRHFTGTRHLEYRHGDAQNGVTWSTVQRYLRARDTAAKGWNRDRILESLQRVNRVAPSKWLTSLEGRYLALVAEAEARKVETERVKKDRKGKVDAFLAKLNTVRLAAELINVLTNILT